MQNTLLLVATALTVLWPLSIRAVQTSSSSSSSTSSSTLSPLSLSSPASSTALPPVTPENNDEYDGESSRKIIGSRVVTSVSVVLNGQQEPQFTDAAGNYIPRPLVPPRVASPINLLNPDRYEFYTFNDDGDLVKRLMTMKEIQSIVANGDSDQQVMAKDPSGALDADVNIREVVNKVQKVLNKEIEHKSNVTNAMKPSKLDTPDTSSSWSSILPAIFGNTGESIAPNSPPPAPAVSSTSTTTSKKPIVHKTPPSTTTKSKPKPPKRTTARPQKIRPNENRIPVRVVSSNANHVLTVKRPIVASSSQPSKQSGAYSTTSTRPHSVSVIKHGSSSSQPTKHTSSSRPTHYATDTTRKPANVIKVTSSALNSIATNKPLQLVGTKAETTVKRPVSLNKLSNKPTKQWSSSKPTKSSSTHGLLIRKTPPTPASVTISSSSSSSSAATTHNNNQNKFPSYTQTPITYNLFTLPAFTAKPSTHRVRPESTATYGPTSTPNESRFSTTIPTMVTVKLISPTDEPTTYPTTNKRISSTHYTASSEFSSPTTPIPPVITTETDEPTTEMPNIFDSDLSLNQIIEALRDTEATTMTFVPNFNDGNELYDTTSFDEQTGQPAMDNVRTESVQVFNNGVDRTTQSNQLSSASLEFKEAMNDRVTYIPQTTTHTHPQINSNSIFEQSNEDVRPYATSTRIEPPSTESFVNVMQHKSGSDEMELKGSGGDNSMENILRESFDHVLQQVQSDEKSTTSFSDDSIEYSTIALLMNNDIENSTVGEKKKVVFKPIPEISTEGLINGSMTYFENVVNELAKEKDATTLAASTIAATSTTADLSSSSSSSSSTPASTSTAAATTTTTSTSGSTSTSTGTKTEYSTENQPEYTEINTIDATTELLLSTIANRLFADTTTLQQVPVDETTFKDTTENDSPTGTERLIYSTEAISTPESLTETERATTLFADENTTANDASNDQDVAESNGLRSVTSTISSNDVSTNFDFDYASTTMSDESFTDSTSEPIQSDSRQTSTTTLIDSTIADNNGVTTEDAASTNYEMVKLIETVSKENSVNVDEKPLIGVKKTSIAPSTSSLERKEDSHEEKPTAPMHRDEIEFSNLGETLNENDLLKSDAHRMPIKSVLNRLQSALDDISKGKLPPPLESLKKKVSESIKKASTIQLDPAPKQALGLEESTVNANDDILEFTKFCNELAFDFWRALHNDGVSSARSIALSPFALNSMLAMTFLGVRGRTSAEINDLLHLDDIVTFNPHAIFRNITESVNNENDPNVYTSAFVREILSDRSKGKILSFYKEKIQQFYSGYVEEVNFNTVNDIIRRRTNMLVKRYTDGEVLDYLKSNNVWVRKPLAAISANVFETNCVNASKVERDGEMFFQVLPSLRQRRLVPIPAAVWKTGFTAGYDPELDATAVAIGLKDNVVSTVFVMPGQQGHSAPGDNLERLESVLMANGVRKNSWRRLLATLMERPGLEVQIPRFTHRSFVNTTNALQKLGLKSLFNAQDADLRGITGSTTRDMYLSDLFQINTFSLCGDDKLPEEHHVEMYPAPPNKLRTIHYDQRTNKYDYSGIPLVSLRPPALYDYEAQRAFVDPLFDLKYMDLPLPLRPRQARVPETPRLRFDKPFLYFARHNPTGMILYMGRFNPRLLP